MGSSVSGVGVIDKAARLLDVLDEAPRSLGELVVATGFSRATAHRLAVAALSEATDTKLFEVAAAQAIARFSGGVPRLVNVLAHKCLMLAYGENEHRVTLRHAHLAAADTPGVTVSRRWWGAWWSGRAGLWRSRKTSAAKGAATALHDDRLGGSM